MEEAIQEEKYKGYTIKIYPEMEPENPREEWDNLGTMICFHPRYSLGDKTDLKASNFQSLKEVEDYLINEKGAVIILPLVLLDHSGLWMRVGNSYDCDPGGWDTSRVGFIYASKDKILKEYSAKTLNKALLKKAEETLKMEIKTYSQYLEGNVVGYQIEDYKGKNVAGCYGYYGVKDAIEEAKGEIRGLINYQTQTEVARIKNEVRHFEYLYENNYIL